MKKSLWIFFFLFLGSNALFSLGTNGDFITGAYGENSDFNYGVEFYFEHQYRPQLSFNFLFGGSYTAMMGAEIDYGMPMELHIGFEPRFYFSDDDLAKLYLAPRVSLGAMEMPGRIAIGTNYILDYATHFYYDLGVRLGYNIYPLNFDYFGKEIRINIEPFFEARYLNFFANEYGSQNGFWYGFGIQLKAGIVSLYSTRKLDSLLKSDEEEDSEIEEELGNTNKTEVWSEEDLGEETQTWVETETVETETVESETDETLTSEVTAEEAAQ